MSLTIHLDPVPLRVDGQGDVRVGDTRVLLDLVINAFNDGATAESIVQSYTSLQLTDVYGVLSYYLRHKDEVDGYLNERRRQGQELQRTLEAKQGELKGIRDRLLARRTELERRHAASAQ